MVRSFTGEPVAPDAVERILRTGQRGPSAGFSQGVEFVVVTDEAARLALSGDDAALKERGLRPFTAQAPVLIVICVSEERYTGRYREPDKARARGDAPGEELWHVPYWHTDAGCAMMLVLLAAVDEGLAAGFAGIMGRDEQARIRGLLDIPDAYTAIGIVAVGHGQAETPRGSAATRPRRPSEEIVHRERW